MAFTFVASADNTQPYGLTASVGANTREADSHGNWWGYAGPANNVIQGFSPAGVLLTSINWEDLINMIRDYVLALHPSGSGWTAALGGSGHFGILRDGDTTYLAVYGHIYQGGLSFFEVLALVATAADGTLTVVGVTWTAIGYTVFDDAIICGSFDLMQNKTFADPILTWSDEADHVSWGKVWPSVNAIIANQCCVFDSVRYIPTPSTVATAYYNFGVSTMGGGFFAMPYQDGVTKTKVLIYVSRAMQAANHASGACPWLESNYATYPFGFMAQIDFGAVVSPTVHAVGSGFASTDSPVAPSVDPDCFVDAAVPYSAFPDAGEYLDGTTGVRSDSNDYHLPPYVEAVGDGTYKVIWYEFFDCNNTYVGGDWVIVGRLRIQIYDPATGLFTDAQIIEGDMATINQIGAPGSSDNPGTIQIINFAIYTDGANIFVWSIDGGAATATGRLQVWLVEYAAPVAALLPGIKLLYRRVRA